MAFRNAMAVSVLLRSWTARHDDGRLYSDVFDFHATIVGGNDRLITHTAALVSLYSDDAPFKGMPAPHVHQSPFGMAVDYYIHRALTHEWLQRFQMNQDDSARRALFRSLEVAYMAMATPLKNQASLTDWGINIVLWVSALEILAHPNAHGRKGKVNQLVTLDLLGEYRWKSESLNEARWPIVMQRAGGRHETRMINAIQRACRKLYEARHSFLHGDPVERDTLFPFDERVALSLIHVAPLVYRTALAGFLQGRVDPHRGFRDEEYESTNPGYIHVIQMIGEEWTVENAAREMFGLARRDGDVDDLDS